MRTAGHKDQATIICINVELECTINGQFQHLSVRQALCSFMSPLMTVSLDLSGPPLDVTAYAISFCSRRRPRASLVSTGSKIREHTLTVKLERRLLTEADYWKHFAGISPREVKHIFRFTCFLRKAYVDII